MVNLGYPACNTRTEGDDIASRSYRRTSSSFSWSLLALTLAALILGACGNSTTTGTTPKQTTNSSATVTLANVKKTPTNPSLVATTLPEAGCSFGEIRQSMSGAISGCYRIPNLRPGTYWLSVDQGINQRGANATKQGFPTTNAQGNSGPHVLLSLAPSNGPPGSVITIHGRVSGNLSPLPSYANFCWAGCEVGLQYDGVPLTWSGTHNFVASLTLPSGPWIARNNDLPAYPKIGSYEISVQCLVSFRGCGLGSSEGKTNFSITSNPPSSKQILKLSAKGVYPGQVVKIGGSVPLVNIIGSKQPFVFQFNMTPKAISTYHLIKYKKSGNQAAFVDLGAIKVKVEAAASLSSYPLKSPTNPQLGGLSAIAINQSLPGVVLGCTQSGITELNHGTRSNIAVSTLGSLLGSPSFGPHVCSTVVDYKTSSGQLLVAAGFSSQNSSSTGPPFTLVPVITTDLGKTWSQIPTPSGLAPSSFEGFAQNPNGISVFFNTASNSLAVETTTNAKDWITGSLKCTQSGGCVRFGGVGYGNCAMNGSSQSLLFSKSSNATLKQIPWPSSVNACFESELFKSGSNRYLLSGSSSYSLRISSNGGANWEVVSGVPSLPGLPPYVSSNSPETILPNGSLIEYSPNNALYLLSRQLKWCKVGTQSTLKNVGPYLVPGRKNVYFEQYLKSGTTLGFLSDSKIHCSK